MTRVPVELRRKVHQRAQSLCEYCLIHEEDAFWSHQVDHIFAEKHGGVTLEDNLCLSCADCNRYKGSDLCSFDPASGEIVTLFHPRRDVWSEHFRYMSGEILTLTPKGRVTARLLHFNDDERVVERFLLWKLRRYPPQIN